MKTIFLVVSVVFSASAGASIFSPSNYAECILQKMSEVANDPAAYAVAQVCNEEFPGGYANVEQGSGRGILGYKSGAKCAVAIGAKTISRKAAGAVRMACNKLYDEPEFDWGKATITKPDDKPSPNSFQDLIPATPPVHAAPDQDAALFKEILADAYRVFPFMDLTSSSGNKEGSDEVWSIRDRYISDGKTNSDAILLAVKQVGPKYYTRGSNPICGKYFSNADSKSACSEVSKRNQNALDNLDRRFRSSGYRP
jgi:hypothetical protein